MTCGAIVDKDCNVAQSVIQSCHQSSMFREKGRETLPFHKYKAFVYDDCASHEAFFFSCQRYPCIIIYLFRHEPPLRRYGIFLLNVLSSPDMDERIFWYSRILQKLYNTSGYHRNLKKKRNRAAKMVSYRHI